jgi:hypothetical protein
MAYNSEVLLTTKVIADMLNVTPQRVRDIAREMTIKPSWIGPTMVFTFKQLGKMKDRETVRGRKKSKKRRAK